MRHGDFGNWCTGIPVEECFASIPVIARRVREVQEELAVKFPGMNVRHVVMTSDERDEAWWDLVKAQGWYRVDHSNTATQYGRWFVLPFLSPLCCEPHPLLLGILSSSMLLFNPRAWASLVLIDPPSPFSLVAE